MTWVVQPPPDDLGRFPADDFAVKVPDVAGVLDGQIDPSDRSYLWLSRFPHQCALPL